MNKKTKRALFFSTFISGLIIIGLLIMFIGFPIIMHLSDDTWHFTATIKNIGYPIFAGIVAYPLLFLLIRFSKKNTATTTLASSRWKTVQELDESFPWIKVDGGKNV